MGSQLQLPIARSLIDPTDAPSVVAVASSLWLDGQALTESTWLEGSRPKPLVELIQVLVNKRKLWDQLNPRAQGFPGVLQVWTDRRLPVRGLKSIVLSAAAAGYPNLSFMARYATAPREVGRLLFDGRVTPSWNRKARNEPELLVEIVSDSDVVLTWRTNGQNLAKPRWMRIDDLWRNAEAEWRSRGSHFVPRDLKLDRAVVDAPDSTPTATLFRVLDALASPQRRMIYEERDEPISVFELTFAVAESELPQYLKPTSTRQWN